MIFGSSTLNTRSRFLRPNFQFFYALRCQLCQLCQPNKIVTNRPFSARLAPRMQTIRIGPEPFVL